MQKLLILWILLPNLVLAQSGWTRAKGAYFAKLDVAHLTADTYYNPSGGRLNTNTFSQTSIHFFGEYGLKKRITLVASWPLLRVNRFETTKPVFGLGDLRLGAKYALMNGAWPVSISITPEFPTGRANAFAESKIDPLERINLPTGDGEWNVWTTLAASKSFGKAYASLFGAFNARSKIDDQKLRNLYQLGAEIGVQPIKSLWVNAKLHGQNSIGQSKSPNLSFVRGDATTYTLLSGEVFYQFNQQFGLSATYLTGGNWIFPFKNIYIAPYFSLGMIYQRD
jgi:hypothetical protein